MNTKRTDGIGILWVGTLVEENQSHSPCLRSSKTVRAPLTGAERCQVLSKVKVGSIVTQDVFFFFVGHVHTRKYLTGVNHGTKLRVRITPPSMSSTRPDSSILCIAIIKISLSDNSLIKPQGYPYPLN